MKFFKYHSLAFLISQVFSLLIIINIASCGCNKEGISRDGSIIMQLPTDPLIGDQKTVVATFTLETVDKVTELDNFTLDVKIIDELGDLNNGIIYHNKQVAQQRTTHIYGSLRDIASVNALTAANPSCKVEIDVIPNAATTQMGLKFSVTNKLGVLVAEGQVMWKAAAKYTELHMVNKSSQNMKGAERTINIEIENRGTVPTEWDKLKLVIERDGGTEATIIGASQVKNTARYTLNLPLVGAKDKISYPVTIDPKEDQQFTLRFQLEHAGQKVNNAGFKVNWERGAELKVINAIYNPETGKVTAIVKNVGTETATKGKIVSEVTTSGALIDGKTKTEFLVNDLQPGAEQKLEDFASLDFGKRQGDKENLSAVCKFGVSCAQSCPNTPQPIVQKVFTKAFILLSLDIEYDIDKSLVKLKLQNTGKDTAEGLQLTYDNISSDPEGKVATLNTKQAEVIAVGNLATNQEYEHLFVLDLKDAEEAEFDFKVLYDNNPIEESKKKVKAKPINLSLEIGSVAINNGMSYLLYGADNKVKLKIKQESGGRDINMELLKLSIQKETEGTISQTEGGIAVEELVGDQLGKLGDAIKLYINPLSGAKEARFKFQLTYKGKPIDEPVLVEWREYALEIIPLGRLVGDQEGSFQIRSQVPINLDALDVTLEGDNGTTFQIFYLDGQSVGSQATLSKVAEYNNISTKDETKSINIRINEKNGQKKASLNIIVKRGATEIAIKKVDWVDKGVGLGIKLDRSVSYDIQPLVIGLKNTTKQPIDLRNVKVKLTNTANISFTLGNYSGDSIDKTLAEITGQNELRGQTKLYTSLEANNPVGSNVATGLILTLLDSKDEIIDQAYFLYYGRSILIESEMAKMLDGNESEFNQKLSKIKDDLGSLAYLVTTLQNLIMSYKNMSAKLMEIRDIGPNFEPLVNSQLTLQADSIKKWSMFEQLTQSAILALSNNETVLLAWHNRVLQEAEEIKKKMVSSTEDLQSVNSVVDIFKFLLIGYNDTKDIHEQSIKALYSYYKNKIEETKSLLIHQGIEDFSPASDDTESIKKLKVLYKNMVADLSGIQAKAQEAFDAGFKKFNNIFVQQQNEFNPQKRDDQKKIDDGLYMLKIQKKVLRRWKHLADYEPDLIPGADAIQDNLAKLYQIFAEKNLIFARKVYKRTDAGNLVKVAELAVEIAKDSFEISQTRKSQLSLEAASKTHDAAIKTWQLSERSRGVSDSSLRKPQTILESSGEFKLTPTVYQDLEAKSKSLKSAQGKGGSKKKNRFDSLNPFRRSRKVN